jgi:hypothetical protein
MEATADYWRGVSPTLMLSGVPPSTAKDARSRTSALHRDSDGQADAGFCCWLRSQSSSSMRRAAQARSAASWSFK